ncbi:Mur ligase domain-containing protein, partial [Rhodococcus sp. ENV425]
MPSSPDPSPPGGGLRPEHPPVTQLRDLAAAVGATVGTVAPGATTSAAGIPVFVTGVDLRAQGVQPGDLFAALPGARAHGAEYAAEALERGAVAVLTDAAGCEHLAAVVTRPVPVLVHPDPRSVLGVVSAAIYGDPSQHMQVVGITGTSGKTTSAYLVEAGLAAAGRVTGLV